jgi:hypothetical protein
VRLRLSLLPTHDTQFRFRGAAPGQGEIDYRINFTFQSSEVRTLGTLGSIVQVKSIKAAFAYGRSFNPAILTSERRSVDPVLRKTYDDSARNLGLDLQPGEFDVETVRNRDGMTAPALSAKPFGDTSITVGPIQPDIQVRDWVKITVLVSALVALGLTPLLIPLLAIVLIPLVGPAVVAAATLATLVAILLAAGLAYVLVQFIAPLVLNQFVRDQICKTLSSTEFKGRLDDQFFMTYAGEGLAEALAVKALAEARNQGLNLPDAEPGRRRFRAQFWQTVFVSDGRMRILVKK